MLLALTEDNFEAGYEVLQNAGTREEIDAFYQQVVPLFEGAESFELKQRGWQKNATNGVTAVDVTFEVKLSDGRTYYVTCTETEGVEGLTGFHVRESESDIFAETPFGVRAVFFAVSALLLALSVWMIVDCIKRKPDGMLLWLVLLLCAVKFTFAVNNGQFNLNWSIGLIVSFSSIGIAGNSMLVNLSLPVGTIVYFFLRKRLPVKKAETQSTEPVEGTCTELSSQAPAQEPAQEVSDEPTDEPTDEHKND